MWPFAWSISRFGVELGEIPSEPEQIGLASGAYTSLSRLLPANSNLPSVGPHLFIVHEYMQILVACMVILGSIGVR